jgi:hypothetical protein
LLGSAVQLTVAELNLRDGPSVAARRVASLTRGAVLEVVSGPVEAEGYTWYSGSVISASGGLPRLPQELDESGLPASGWLAVAKGPTPYVTLLAPRCPDIVDLLNVSAQLPSERLACFGSTRIVLQGVSGCDGCGGLAFGLFEPEWLIHPLTGEPLRVAAAGPGIMVRFDPAGPARPAPGSIVRVTGHFDDPAAQTCRLGEGGPDDTPVPVVPAIAILTCRQEFVVDSYEFLGMDPSFPPS